MMRPEEIESVRNLPLLRNVPLDRMEMILKGAFLQRFPAHVELIREDETPDFLHVVVDGQVEIFARYRDRQTTVAVLGHGNSFIAAAVILNRPYLMSARVLSPARILMLPAASVRDFFGEDAEFARCLTMELALAYRESIKEIKNQKLRATLERAAAWFVREQREAGGKTTFEIPFEKKTLASRLGMVPEVLSRIFLTLRQYGVVIEGRSITLNDPEALVKLARPDPLIDDPNT